MEKKSVGKKVGSFFTGKGFYAVLAVCALLIGASAWALIRSADEPETMPQAAAPVETPETLPQSQSTTAKPASTSQPIHIPEEILNPEHSEETEEEVAEETREVAQTVSGWVWPVSGEVSAAYSPDTLVYNITMADWRTHPAMDLAAGMGTRVSAVAAGTVEAVGQDDLLGTWVRVRHSDSLTSFYANLAATPAVEEGDTVLAGDTIGAVGDTALGEIGEVAHLHFAMEENGESVDPGDYLPGR